jgi:arabinose-5-phosphate isomerase
MHQGDGIPRVREDTPLREVMIEIMEKRLGITTVLDREGRLAGVISDGDFKRILCAIRIPGISRPPT